ncbi:rRNA maturation RNase YbeY [soil metagenome]
MFPDNKPSTIFPKLEIFNPSGHTLPFNSRHVSKLIRSIELKEKVRFSDLEIVFTDEEEIIKINSQYLDKDYVTDIISFRYDEGSADKAIEGTLYCCASRIEEQSREFDTDPEEEFLRIIVHGALHLAGYDDQTEQDKENMRNLENFYLTKVIGRN